MFLRMFWNRAIEDYLKAFWGMYIPIHGPGYGHNSFTIPTYGNKIYLNWKTIYIYMHSYFHKQTEYTLIRQLLQELSDLGLLCLQIC